jgi:hypothetical protein
MLERLAPKLVKNIRNIELLEHIAKPLYPGSIPSFNEFCATVLDEREIFHGDSVDYLVQIVDHFNRTFEKFVSLGGFTRSRTFRPQQEWTCIPENFSASDRFLFCGVVEKLTDPEMFAFLVKPLPMIAEGMFVEVRRNAFIELRDFKGTACAYFTLQLTQVHVVLAEVIALHKFGPKAQ